MKKCYKVNSLWCVYVISYRYIICTNIKKSKRDLLLGKLNKKRKTCDSEEEKIVDKLRRTYEFRISCIQLQLPRG